MLHSLSISTRLGSTGRGGKGYRVLLFIVVVYVALLLCASPCVVNGALDSALEGFAGGGAMNHVGHQHQPWGDIPFEPVGLDTDYAESVMPQARGRKTVVIGSLLILLFLFLTAWKIQGNPSPGTAMHVLQQAQSTISSALNTPTRDLNQRLEEHGKALSMRLLIFAASAVALLLGSLEILFSARQRYKHKREFPILRRAPSMKTSAFLMLVLAIVAAYGVVMAWPLLGQSLYV